VFEDGGPPQRAHEEGDKVARHTAGLRSSAPRELATPTDLKPEDVQKIADTVNPVIADALALYVKTKNFHWHVAGPHFRDYHLLFDEQAASLLEGVDLLAERVRKLGGTTLRSIGHIAQLTGVADDDDQVVPAGEMIRRLLEDNRLMAARQRAAIDVCDDHGDTPTGNLLQEILDQTERRIWFLFEVSQADHS
jgi:starvation-inducible DNA-binding protein